MEIKKEIMTRFGRDQRVPVVPLPSPTLGTLLESFEALPSALFPKLTAGPSPVCHFFRLTFFRRSFFS